MMRFQIAVIPHGVESLILPLIEKKRVFFFTPLCGGVKWMMRAEQKKN